MKKINEDVKITRESDLTDFDFWSGAKITVKYLTDDELRQIADMLDEIHPDGMTETEVNDFFWFDDDTIAEWLGYSSFDELMEDREEDLKEDTNGETVASYQGEGKDTVDVVKGSDGKFVHSYKKDGKEVSHSDSFSTQDEAEKALVKNNPKAKKLNEASSNDDRKAALAEYFGVDVDQISDSGDAYTFDKDGEDVSFLVMDDEEALDAASDFINQLYDELGLDAFTPGFVNKVVDEALDSDKVDAAIDDMAEAYMNDIESEDDDAFGNRLIAEMYEEGILDDPDFEYGLDDNPNYTKLDLSPDAWDSKKLHFKSILKDSYGDPVEFLKANGIDLKGFIDMAKVVDMAIDLDGFGHFLATYDGKEIELPNGLMGFRID